MLIVDMMIMPVILVMSLTTMMTMVKVCCLCRSCFLDAHDDSIHDFAEAGGG